MPPAVLEFGINSLDDDAVVKRTKSHAILLRNVAVTFLRKRQKPSASRNLHGVLNADLALFK